MPSELTESVLARGELRLEGRLVYASNASFLGDATLGETTLRCVYKPVRGERPLDDFAEGTLSHREVAAHLLSEYAGWNIVPPTVWRSDGPFGAGMAQLWIEADPTVDIVALVQGDAPALRVIAVFDAVINNGDRKGGHLLPLAGGHIYGVDHGVSFSVEPKLRTVLWGWRGQPLDDDTLATLRRVRGGLGGELGSRLRDHLDPAEIEATRRRIDALLESEKFPMPDPYRRVVPWPPF